MTLPARTARLAEVDLPVFGMPDVVAGAPTVTLRRRDSSGCASGWTTLGYDRLVVYADREHSANLSFLTGFDPRFEEAILVLGPTDAPAILAGNECYGMAGAAPLPMRRHLFQDLSLPSQPRDRSRPLADILAGEGIGPGSRVGVLGWKAYADRARMEVPAFLVDELRGLTGSGGLVENANDLLIDPADGLRIINDADQLAVFEHAATRTSNGVRNLSDRAPAGDARTGGGRAARMGRHATLVPSDAHRRPAGVAGLLSPGDRTIERGDRLTVAFGIWGALNCRAGFVVEDAAELPAGIRDYVDRLVAPYFEAVVEWYEALHVGQTGGALQSIIDRRLADPFFGIFLNPGHQISSR